MVSPSLGRRIVAPGVAVFKKLLLDRLMSSRQSSQGR